MLCRRLTKELEEKAKNELKETPEIREESLSELKEWINAQKFSSEYTSDLFLLNFLRGCKFNQEKVREKLSQYFFVKSKRSDIFEDRDPASDTLQKLMSLGILLLIPAEDKDIIMVRWENYDSDVTLLNVLKLGLMIFDTYINESNTCMHVGQDVIIDCKRAPMCWLRQLSPSMVKDLVYILLKAYPLRIKAVYILNSFSIINFLFRTFKSMLPTKLISRIHFFNNTSIDELSQPLLLLALPKEYGGEGESIDTLTELTRSTLEKRRTLFLNPERKEQKTCY